MFNPNQITQNTIGRIAEHYGLLASQVDIPELRRSVALLVDIANRDTVSLSDQDVATIIDATQHILYLLFCTPFSKCRLPIPDAFWHEPDSIGLVLSQVRTWLRHTLVNYTDAAMMLNGVLPDNQAAAVAVIRRKVEQGKLVGFVDPFESNPQHARRVRRTAIEVYRRQHVMQQGTVA